MTRKIYYYTSDKDIVDDHYALMNIDDYYNTINAYAKKRRNEITGLDIISTENMRKQLKEEHRQLFGKYFDIEETEAGDKYTINMKALDELIEYQIDLIGKYTRLAKLYGLNLAAEPKQLVESDNVAEYDIAKEYMEHFGKNGKDIYVRLEYDEGKVAVTKISNYIEMIDKDTKPFYFVNIIYGYCERSEYDIYI